MIRARLTRRRPSNPLAVLSLRGWVWLTYCALVILTAAFVVHALGARP